jgi:hypothetical protein
MRGTAFGMVASQHGGNLIQFNPITGTKENGEEMSGGKFELN